MYPILSALAFASLFLTAAPAARVAQSSVETALAQAGVYLDTFRGQVAGVVLEEKYLQQAQGQVTLARELRSDLAVMEDVAQGWIEFRDVFEVDGKPVRDRRDRVVELFTHPSGNALEQARRIVREGARFNLNALGVQFDRTINLPMAALMFLRAENQSRSKFHRDAYDSVAGRRVTVLRFEEIATPRLMGSVDQAPASGLFWIEQDTGRVLRTRLVIRSRRGTTDTTATIDVVYAETETLQLWLPQAMEESYLFTDGMGRAIATISGRALYSNPRKFRVSSDEAVSEPATR